MTLSSLVISWVTEPKLTEFLFSAEGSLPVLMHLSQLSSSNPFLYARAMNEDYEGGVGQFLSFGNEISCRSNVPSAIGKQRSDRSSAPICQLILKIC